MLSKVCSVAIFEEKLYKQFMCKLSKHHGMLHSKSIDYMSNPGSVLITDFRRAFVTFSEVGGAETAMAAAVEDRMLRDRYSSY